MKEYNNLSDVEKKWVREYYEWTKCDIIPLALEREEHFIKLLLSHDLNISNYIRK